jgi:hypothetical protein
MIQIESLEGRKLLSGNVSTQFSADEYTLAITGDARSNEIVVSTDALGVTTVTPLPGTTINGSPNPETFSDAGTIVIDTGNGYDYVGLTHLYIQDCLISTGNGSDTVSAYDSNLFFRLDINTGAGSDEVTLAGQTGVGSGIAIDLGTGKDLLAISGDLWVKGDGVGDPIDGGNGSDVLDRSAFTGSFPAVDTIDVEQIIT